MIEYILDFRDDSLINLLIPDELLREHLILIDDESELLGLYKEAAIASAEKFMNRPLLKSTIILSTATPNFRLPYGGFSVTSAVDANDNPVQYLMNRVTKKIQIQGSPTFPVQFEVHCDFSADGNHDVPQSIVLGLCMAVATSFQNRESNVMGISVTEIPQNHQAIFRQYRLPNINGGGS
ncbi:hypothetical protein [Aeromonas hydrophila]